MHAYVWLMTDPVRIPRSLLLPHSAVAVDRWCLAGHGHATPPSGGLGTSQGTQSVGEGLVEVTLDPVCPGMGIVFSFPWHVISRIDRKSVV